MSIVTLGSGNMGQLLESAEGELEKHYIHHYNMPPYASGETGRYGNPGRREIGHGALAERALPPVIPSQDEFPYTIRVVADAMSVTDSARILPDADCNSSFEDAGVPIK